jgi:ATP synthase protein I
MAGNHFRPCLTGAAMLVSLAVVSPENLRARPSGPSESRGDWSTALRQAAPYLGIGTTLAATALLGLGVGYWLDQRLKASPWFLLVGGVLGLLGAFYQFFKTVAGLSRK